MKGLPLLKDKQWRKQKIRYWVFDPFWGSLNYITHYALRYVPIEVNAKIGAFLGELAGKYRFRIQNARTKRNLKILRPELNEFERDAIAVKMWRNIGQSMTEYSILDKLYAVRKVTLENNHYLQPFIDNKQPVIFIFAHTGNWEVCGNYVIDYGFDVLGLYKPVRSRFSRRIADNARVRLGGVIKLLDTNSPNAMRLVCKHLANKGALWIAIDELKNSQICSPRFGRDLSLHNTNAAYAVRLAQRYAATLIPVWNKRNPDLTFSVTIGEPFTVANDELAANEALSKLDRLLEEWIRANLEQWYMLHQIKM
jgi:Kdo2-lipid IVA lauroyltransferase/acyltransferase